VAKGDQPDDRTKILGKSAAIVTLIVRIAIIYVKKLHMDMHIWYV
jgi:hypothetical protein